MSFAEGFGRPVPRDESVGLEGGLVVARRVFFNNTGPVAPVGTKV